MLLLGGAEYRREPLVEKEVCCCTDALLRLTSLVLATLAGPLVGEAPLK